MFLNTVQGGLNLVCTDCVVALLGVVAYPFKIENVTVNFGWAKYL